MQVRVLSLVLNIMSRKHNAGKGDTYRKVDTEQYSKNYDLIFKKKRKNGLNKTNKRRTTES